MKVNSKINGRQRRQFINRQVTLFVLFVLSSSLLFGQTRLTGFLNVDDGTHRIDQDGTNYIDYIIPQPGAYPYLTISARGGDGGKIHALNSLWDNIITAKSHGGQGATAVATFKIGTGANELAPGATLRVIVGRGGDSEISTYYGLTDIGAGGGGGTGVLYLPGGADGNTPSNWKILLVAGGGGGALMLYTGLVSKPKVVDGLPGQTSEQGDTMVNFGYGIKQLDPYFPFSMNGNGGSTYIWGGILENQRDIGGGGGGGGTSFLTYQQAANGLSWGQGYNNSTNGSTLMGDGSIECFDNLCKQGGKGLFQWANGKLVPIGGMGGPADQRGGYGMGGGGGGDKHKPAYWGTSGGGGGYSGGSAGGGGGGSYINSGWVMPNTDYKLRNGLAENPINGFVEYKFSGNCPVVKCDRYLKADKGTEVRVLETNGWVLLWQYDGNLVLYQNGVAKWASNTQNKGTALRFQGDGNLVIYQNGVAVWASNTANDEKGGKGGRKLVLTPEGSLYIVDQDGKVIWKGH